MTAHGVLNRDTAHLLDAQPAAANPEAEKLEAYPLLDWLRYALASVVLLGHERVVFPGPINGSLAVAVFLALSGWLIGGILIRSDRADLPRFFYNRSTRIWAPYAGAAALLYLTAALRHGIDANWFKYLFYDATFTHITFTVFPRALHEMPLGGTGNHFWSISVEEQFYLAAPLLMLFTRWGKSLALWGVVALALMALQSVFAPIAAGVCAAVLNRDHAIVATAARRWIAAVGAAVALAALWMWNVEPWRALFSIGVVLALTAPGRRGRLGVFAGGISYPLYLNQWVGGFAVQAADRHLVGLPLPLHLALTYIASVAVATGAWFVIDRQVMRARGKWFTRARGRTLGIIAYTLVGIGFAGGTALRLAGY